MQKQSIADFEKIKSYIGHEAQLYGVEVSRLCGGKGDGMLLFTVRNGSGLEFAISADRCADISRLSFKGDNFSYFSPCGYVSPKFYDNKGAGFLKSFTAGFFTTCGLTSVGGACVDDGEELPLHGTISHTPCESISHWIEDGKIHIKAIIRDASIFSHRLILTREYICPIGENIIYMTDEISNIGASETPLEILYHCNMGYPLLSENARVTIPSTEVLGLTDIASAETDTCLIMEKPQSGYSERCFYHKMHGDVSVSIFNDEISKGLEISYNADELKYFTEWKLMGDGEYVLGLEPGNCLPQNRAIMREKGILEFLSPGEKRTYHLKFAFIEK